MAKGNFLMNTVAGKLGNMVLYRSKGEQKARTYIKTVANPKTASQLNQRSQLSNVIAMYRAIKADIKNGFEDKKAKESTYNAFVRANLNVIKVFLTKEQASAQACIAAPYTVTKGSVRAVGFTGAGEDAVTNLAVGSLVIDANTTVGQLSAALVENNGGISYGMKLSYLSVIQVNNVNTGFPMCTARMYGMNLIENDETLVKDVLPVQAYAVKNGFLAHGEKVAVGGFCWILSKKDEMGSLRVSTQSLIVTSGATYAQYTGAQAMSRAATSYGAQVPIPLNPDAVIVETTAPMPGTISNVTYDGAALAGTNPPSWLTTKKIAILGSNMEAAKASIFVSDSNNSPTDAQIKAGAILFSTYGPNYAGSKTKLECSVPTAITPLCVAVVYDGVVAYKKTYQPKESEDMG